MNVINKKIATILLAAFAALAMLGCNSKTGTASDTGIIPGENTPPIITLNGANPMSINLGVIYKEPGVTAYDKEDGDITSEIQTTGIVDETSLGENIITYTVSDSEGLTDTKIRTVNVVLPVELKKTGQTTRYEDGDDGDLQKGIDPSYTQNSDGTITDNITGLIWQNDLNTSQTVVLDQQIAKDQCDALALGGFTDWRLPTIEELQYIVDIGEYDPAISPEFLNTNSSYYWSSSKENNTNRGWQIYFEGGTDHYQIPNTTYPGYVRCVRGSSTTSTFEKNGDIVTDNLTKLQWQDNSDVNDTTKQKNWADAITYCETLTLGSFNDWRLPNINELLSIVDKNKVAGSPAIRAYMTVFEYVVYTVGQSGYNDLYWSSSTPNVNNDTTYTDIDHAIAVNFYYGDEYYFNFSGFGDDPAEKIKENYVRCVRGGN